MFCLTVMSSSGYKKVETVENYPIKLNEVAVDALNQIIEATDAKIVITSTYRRKYIIGEIRDNFIQQGVIDAVVKATPVQNSREEEIKTLLDNKSFIRRYNVDGYIILDDNLLTGFNKHFLLVGSGSLSDEYVSSCIDILNFPMSDLSIEDENIDGFTNGFEHIPEKIGISSISTGRKKMSALDFEHNNILNNKKIKNMKFVNTDSQKVQRNSICPCGSGKKYKKCCLKKV